MAAFENYYYSGQGSLYIAERDAGKPAGLVRVGNVPELTIDVATTVYEHKESESGDRLLDLSLNKENKSTFQFKLENMSLDNLALGLYGANAAVTGASVNDELVTMYSDKAVSLAYPDVSGVTVTAKDGVDAVSYTVTTYTLGDYVIPTSPNAHYYKVTVAGLAVGEPSWPVNGTTVTDGAVTFQDMGLIIRTVDTDYTVLAKFGMIEPTQALAVGVGIDNGRVYQIDYTYASSNRLDVFTVAAPERWLRFEGLNTVDGSRVIVDIFKAKFEPLSGYGLIVEDIAGPTMKGTVLYDALQLTGSKYFRQWNVSA